MFQSKYAGTHEVLEAIEFATPDYSHVAKPEIDKWDRLFDSGPVTWVGNHYILAVPVENVNFMEGNIWNFDHAAALVEGIETGSHDIFSAPPARVWRIKAGDIKRTQRHARDGDLEYEYGMVVPWDRDDLRSYHAQLVDGNHRAAAAMVAGARYIYVYVLPNHREQVFKKDWE